MGNRAGMVSVLAVAAVLAGCSGSTPTAPAAPHSSMPSAASSACVVGVAWADDMAGRWTRWDEPAIKKALSDAGATYRSTDTKTPAGQQVADVDSLIAQGAKVLIVNATDAAAIAPAIAGAIRRGIPVIAYDRLIDVPGALYMSFDNVEVGRMQARALLKAVPKGNYAFIKGDKSDPNADFLRSGQEEVLHAAIASGAIHNVGETYTDGWSADLALAEVEGMISGHTVDAVLAENDSTASGAIIALEDHHRTAAVSGQDGDPAALNQVALGTQTVDVWKDTRLLGSAAGEAAVELCGGTAVDRIRGTSAYTTPSGHSVSSLLIKPVPVTRDNLQSVIDAGWITRDDLCTDVKTGSVAACP